MFGYAIMLSMKETYNFRTCLEAKVLCQLKQYYRNIDQVPNVESICTDNCTWVDYLKAPSILANDLIYSKGHAISYLDDVSDSAIR